MAHLSGKMSSDVEEVLRQSRRRRSERRESGHGRDVGLVKAAGRDGVFDGDDATEG